MDNLLGIAECDITADMGKTAWQLRLERVGYSQKDFAKLIGLSPNAVTTQLSGSAKGKPSRYIKFIIMALEKLHKEQKDALEAEINAED